MQRLETFFSNFLEQKICFAIATDKIRSLDIVVVVSIG